MDKVGTPTTPNSAGPRDDAESVARDWLGGRIDESRFWRSMVKSFNAADVASLAELLRQRDADSAEASMRQIGWARDLIAERDALAAQVAEAEKIIDREMYDAKQRERAEHAEAMVLELSPMILALSGALQKLHDAVCGRPPARTTGKYWDEEVGAANMEAQALLADTAAAAASLLAREREKAASLERLEIARIVAEQPYYPDTKVGMRQQWVKDQILTAIAIRARSAP